MTNSPRLAALVRLCAVLLAVVIASGALVLPSGQHNASAATVRVFERCDSDSYTRHAKRDGHDVARVLFSGTICIRSEYIDGVFQCNWISKAVFSGPTTKILNSNVSQTRAWTRPTVDEYSNCLSHGSSRLVRWHFAAFKYDRQWPLSDQYIDPYMNATYGAPAHDADWTARNMSATTQEYLLQFDSGGDWTFD
jgi:hypothetical protein